VVCARRRTCNLYVTCAPTPHSIRGGGGPQILNLHDNGFGVKSQYEGISSQDHRMNLRGGGRFIGGAFRPGGRA